MTTDIQCSSFNNSAGVTIRISGNSNFPSKWLAWLKSGYAFQVGIDETGRSYPAKVQRLGAKVAPVSQSVKLSTAIDGRFPELVASMSGKVLMALTEGQ